MLLVTFHGGSDSDADSSSDTSNHSHSKPINNVYGYSTKDGTLETKAALSGLPSKVKLDELRAMAVYKDNLYVVNGSKSHSYMFVFQGPPKKGPEFDYLDTVIGPGQSIMHPFAIAFDPSADNCYVSDQDSNVVAQVNLTFHKHGAVTGALAKGSQSSFLNGKYSADSFLDGTFVGSQNGNLVGVAKVAPDVSAANGGLNVTGTSEKGQPLAPANSVRDVAIANGMLFVCNEVDKQINMYNLKDGAFLGSASSNGGSPTHLAVNGKGLWVSADESLYWSALPASATGATLLFKTVTIEVPKKNKIGGISFDKSGNVYVVFQDGTGGTGKGSIGKFAVTASSPPSLSKGTTFATMKDDTPEFCLWVSDSNWPG